MVGYRKRLWNVQRQRGSSSIHAVVVNKKTSMAIDAAAADRPMPEPLNAELHVDLGNAYRQRGMREHAIFEFECAYELLPNRSDIRETLEELMKS